MSQYKVIVQPQAMEDLVSIADFFVLMYNSQATAKKILSSLHRDMSSLDFFPQRFKEYPNTIDGKTIRVMKSGNYQIYYCILDSKKEVHILTILHHLESEESKLDAALKKARIKVSEDTIVPY